MKKVLIPSLTTILFFAGGTLAAPPPELQWENKSDEFPIITRSMDALISLTPAPGAVSNVVIRKHNAPDSVYSTAIHTYALNDGALLSSDIKNIGGRHTTAKGACTGQNGDIITAGSWDNGTAIGFWTAGYRPQPHGWLWDITETPEIMEQASKVVTDEYGSIYVVGNTWSATTGADIVIHKYDSDRNHVWKTTITEEGDDYAYGLNAFDVASTKRLCLALERRKSAGDCHTFTYDISSETGIPNLANMFKLGARIAFGDATPTGARFVKKSSYQAADDCFYISGTLDDGSDQDFWVACCDYQGNYIWERTFDGGHDDWANAIALGFGYVYVAGTSNNGTDNDCRVIRYDEAGNESWNITYGAAADQGLSAICLDPAGNFYVTGYTGDVEADSLQELVIKYSQSDVVGIAEPSSPSSPSSQPYSVTLEIADNLSTVPTILYSIPHDQIGILSIYSSDGRLLESFVLSSKLSSFTWDPSGIPTGVYFVKLSCGSNSVTRKAVLAR